MSPPIISLLLLTTAAAVLISTAAAAAALSPYDVLASYDFPIGILPKGATGYSLDPTTGKFSLYLNGSCSFSLEGSYQLRYKPTISGYISHDRLTSLNGISVKILFLWLNIVEVVRNGDQLGFSVGIASANFGIENFEICPQCGCGLDCNELRYYVHCLIRDTNEGSSYMGLRIKLSFASLFMINSIMLIQII